MQEQEMKINLELFEGPLDLLSHLIKKSDVDIHNIPIAIILDQYNEYLHLMQDLNIDIAGEFILMASELTHLKSKLLLHDENALEEEEADPRGDLITRLLEYQKFKNAAIYLGKQPMLARDVFKRPKGPIPEGFCEEEGLLEIEPFKLLTVFHEILKRLPPATSFEIEPERISITDRIYQIIDVLKNSESVLFEELFKDQNRRTDLVVTFLALLEMAKLRMIQIFQMDRFGPIRVKRVMSWETEIKLEEKDGTITT